MIIIILNERKLLLDNNNNTNIIASEESFLLSHMADPKNAIKSLILVGEQFCIKHFLIIFQF